MAERYKVKVKVALQKGKCNREHQVGDEWILGTTTPEGICLGAMPPILSAARVLMFGGVFPHESDPDIARVACPDPDNPVVFELRRLRE